MKALVWKEYRERRLWWLLLAAACLIAMLVSEFAVTKTRDGFQGVTLRRSGYVFLCDTDLLGFVKTVTPFFAVPFLAALVFGAGSFSSELRGSAQFLLSRPVSWKRLLLAKALVGVAAIAAVSVLSAAVFRFVCPPQYVHLLTFQRLAVGIGLSSLIMGAGYAIGLGCSAGPAAALPILFATYVVVAIGPLTETKPYPLYWTTLGIVIGAAIGSILVIRFGLTVSAGYRAGKLVTAVGIGALCLLPLDAAFWLTRSPALAMAFDFPRPEYTQTSIGPDGSHAVVYRTGEGWAFLGPNGERGRFEERSVRVLCNPASSPGFSAPPRASLRFTSGPVPIHWADANTAYFKAERFGASVRANTGELVTGDLWPLTIVRMDSAGEVHTRRVPVLPEWPGSSVAIPSPDGKLAVMWPVLQMRPRIGPALQREDSKSFDRIPPGTRSLAARTDPQMMELPVIDIQQARVVGSVKGDMSRLWWQSDRTIGYLSKLGARRVVNRAHPKGRAAPNHK